jgi:hypothetical protein
VSRAVFKAIGVCRKFEKDRARAETILTATKIGDAERKQALDVIAKG